MYGRNHSEWYGSMCTRMLCSRAGNAAEARMNPFRRPEPVRCP